MYCHLAKLTDDLQDTKSMVPSSGTSNHENKIQFVFGETHLKAKPDFMEERIRQTLKIT